MEGIKNYLWWIGWLLWGAGLLAAAYLDWQLAAFAGWAVCGVIWFALERRFKSN
jgi:hypothetical protein